MESQKTKIALYAKRSFGAKMNASFDFIKENWKLLLKFTVYLLLPVCLVQAIGLNGMMAGAFSMEKMAAEGANVAALSYLIIYYAVYLVFYLIGAILIASLVYALMRTYREREEGLQGVTLGFLKPLLLRNVKRMIGLILLSVVLVIVLLLFVSALATLSLYTLIFTLPFIFAVVVPLMLWAPVYLFEEIGLIASLKKALRLGFMTWGGAFLIMFVMGLIGSILQGVTMLPWYVASIIKAVFAMSDAGAGAVSPAYNFMLYLLGVVQGFGTYLAMIFSLVGIAYQYGHASETADNVTVESDIENFDIL